MSNIIRKLSSRKFGLAVVGIVVGIAIALGVDASEIETVAGAVLSAISVITYIVTEGKIDAESVKNSIVEIQDAVDLFDEEGGE